MNVRTLSVCLAVTVLPAIALAQGMDHGGKASDPATQDYMAAHEKMMKQMSGMKHTGDPDKDFAMMMIPHHQGAIDMAEIELKHGQDPELKKMAQKIIDDQQKEIADFKKWLSSNK